MVIRTGGRSAVGSPDRLGLRRGGAGGGRLDPRGSRHESSRDRGLVEGRRQVDPRGLGQADHRRRRRPTGRRRPGERRSRDIQRDGTSRLEHQAAVHPTEDGRIVFGAQDRRAGPRQLVEEVGDRRGPRRVELGRRFVEDQDAGAHRHDARDGHALLLAAGQGERLTVGEVADRQAGQRGIDPRVHLVSWHAQVLEAERELLADGLLRRGQLVGRRGEDDPDLAEERAGCRGRRVGAFDDDPTVDLGPDDARDETSRGERQGRLAGARPARHADALAATDRQVDPLQAVLAPSRISDAESFDQERGRRRRGAVIGLRRHRWMTPSANSTTTTAPARISSRSHRSIGGSATTR